MTTAAGDSQQRPWRYGSSFVSLAVGVVLTVGLVVLLLWQAVLIRIPPGHVGVLYRLFGGGTDTAMVHPEGLVAKQPWNTLYIVETRLQALNFNLLAYSAEGMQVGVEATVLYQVKKPEAGKLVGDGQNCAGFDFVECAAG